MISRITRENFEKPKEVFSQTDQGKITSFIFSTGVTDWENREHLWGLFSGFICCLFYTSFSNADPRQMERNFIKPREVFTQNKMIYKNLPHFTQLSHIVIFEDPFGPHFS
jgi:hypothetical protein